MSFEEVFNAQYSSAYDALYADKDYSKECDFIEASVARVKQRVSTILDLGCGTGNHALELARRGYSVHGIDMSRPMLDIAQKKLSACRFGPNVTVEFEHGDIATTRVGRQFDAAIMMFAVLGYIPAKQLVPALNNIRAQLRQGGVLVADFWYGPAVLSQRPSERVRIIESNDRTILRAAKTELDTFGQVATVEYTLFDWAIDGRVARSKERHEMRFFFASEMELMLSSARFFPKVFSAFPQLDLLPTEATWNVAVVAQAA